MSEISTKNRIIWDTNSINMWILADDACRFTNTDTKYVMADTQARMSVDKMIS